LASVLFCRNRWKPRFLQKHKFPLKYLTQCHETFLSHLFYILTYCKGIFNLLISPRLYLIIKKTVKSNVHKKCDACITIWTFVSIICTTIMNVILHVYVLMYVLYDVHYLCNNRQPWNIKLRPLLHEKLLTEKINFSTVRAIETYLPNIKCLLFVPTECYL